MQLLFWSSVTMLVYIYVGYPAVVWLAARRRVRDAAFDEADATYQPRVTVVTAAYNEAAHIEATVRNKLEADYPAERLNVIVVSDESDDGTDDIVRSLGSRVRLIRQTPRAGKTQALNTAIGETDAEIIVFSDANSLYEPDAIRLLVKHFQDPSVGYVTGKMIYVGSDGSVTGDGCTAYMRYENFIRAQESQLRSVIGVDGGVDAVRRSEYVTMRADQQPDFVLPLSILEKRLAVIYEPGAVLREQALEDAGSEYRMRVRVSLRALWALWDKRALLNPFRYPGVAFRLLSHKVLRYLAFVPLALALAANAILAVDNVVYMVLLIGHVTFYLLALAGSIGRRTADSVLVTLPAYFVLINTAAAHAVFRMLRGERMATWKPRVG
ncbi:MAG: glycosyltransferase family 2 protein [Pseudomonadota bacterium]